MEYCYSGVKVELPNQVHPQRCRDEHTGHGGVHERGEGAWQYMSLAVKKAMDNAPPPHAIVFAYISMIWISVGNTRNALAVVGTMAII